MENVSRGFKLFEMDTEAVCSLCLLVRTKKPKLVNGFRQKIFLQRDLLNAPAGTWVWKYQMPLGCAAMTEVNLVLIRDVKKDGNVCGAYANTTQPTIIAKLC